MTIIIAEWMLDNILKDTKFHDNMVIEGSENDLFQTVRELFQLGLNVKIIKSQKFNSVLVWVDKKNFSTR